MTFLLRAFSRGDKQKDNDSSADFVNKMFQAELSNIHSKLAVEDDDIQFLLEMIYDSSFPESQKFLKDPTKDRLFAHKETLSKLLFGLAAKGVPVTQLIVGHMQKYGIDSISDTLLTLLELIQPLLVSKEIPEFTSDDLLDAIDVQWRSPLRGGSRPQSPFQSPRTSVSVSPRFSVSSPRSPFSIYYPGQTQAQDLVSPRRSGPVGSNFKSQSDGSPRPLPNSGWDTSPRFKGTSLPLPQGQNLQPRANKEKELDNGNLTISHRRQQSETPKRDSSLKGVSTEINQPTEEDGPESKLENSVTSIQTDNSGAQERPEASSKVQHGTKSSQLPHIVHLENMPSFEHLKENAVVEGAGDSAQSQSGYNGSFLFHPGNMVIENQQESGEGKGPDVGDNNGRITDVSSSLPEEGANDTHQQVIPNTLVQREAGQESEAEDEAEDGSVREMSISDLSKEEELNTKSGVEGVPTKPSSEIQRDSLDRISKDIDDSKNSEEEIAETRRELGDAPIENSDYSNFVCGNSSVEGHIFGNFDAGNKIDRTLYSKNLPPHSKDSQGKAVEKDDNVSPRSEHYERGGGEGDPTSFTNMPEKNLVSEEKHQEEKDIKDGDIPSTSFSDEYDASSFNSLTCLDEVGRKSCSSTPLLNDEASSPTRSSFSEVDSSLSTPAKDKNEIAISTLTTLRNEQEDTASDVHTRSSPDLGEAMHPLPVAGSEKQIPPGRYLCEENSIDDCGKNPSMTVRVDDGEGPPNAEHPINNAYGEPLVGRIEHERNLSEAEAKELPVSGDESKAGVNDVAGEMDSSEGSSENEEVPRNFDGEIPFNVSAHVGEADVISGDEESKLVETGELFCVEKHHDSPGISYLEMSPTNDDGYGDRGGEGDNAPVQENVHEDGLSCEKGESKAGGNKALFLEKAVASEHFGDDLTLTEKEISCVPDEGNESNVPAIRRSEASLHNDESERMLTSDHYSEERPVAEEEESMAGEESTELMDVHGKEEALTSRSAKEEEINFPKDREIVGAFSTLKPSPSIDDSDKAPHNQHGDQVGVSEKLKELKLYEGKISVPAGSEEEDVVVIKHIINRTDLTGGGGENLSAAQSSKNLIAGNDEHDVAITNDFDGHDVDSFLAGHIGDEASVADCDLKLVDTGYVVPIQSVEDEASEQVEGAAKRKESEDTVALNYDDPMASEFKDTDTGDASGDYESNRAEDKDITPSKIEEKEECAPEDIKDTSRRADHISEAGTSDNAADSIPAVQRRYFEAENPFLVSGDHQGEVVESPDTSRRESGSSVEVGRESPAQVEDESQCVASNHGQERAEYNSEDSRSNYQGEAVESPDTSRKESDSSVEVVHESPAQVEDQSHCVESNHGQERAEDNSEDSPSNDSPTIAVTAPVEAETNIEACHPALVANAKEEGRRNNFGPQITDFGTEALKKSLSDSRHSKLSKDQFIEKGSDANILQDENSSKPTSEETNLLSRVEQPGNSQMNIPQGSFTGLLHHKMSKDEDRMFDSASTTPAPLSSTQMSAPILLQPNNQNFNRDSRQHKSHMRQWRLKFSRMCCYCCCRSSPTW